MIGRRLEDVSRGNAMMPRITDVSVYLVGCFRSTLHDTIWVVGALDLLAEAAGLLPVQ